MEDVIDEQLILLLQTQHQFQTIYPTLKRHYLLLKFWQHCLFFGSFLKEQIKEIYATAQRVLKTIS